MNILNSLLVITKEERTAFQIIGWWEIRRVLYNLIVLICGLISMKIMSVLVCLEPGEDLQEPIAIIGFAVLCNLGYSLGWLTEIFNKRNHIHPKVSWNRIKLTCIPLFMGYHFRKSRKKVGF